MFYIITSERVMSENKIENEIARIRAEIKKPSCVSALLKAI